eukprot:TRINITY_DN24324_c0_g1_i1.p1 TRINITY_DN24324_c0_g1~~TRINITY_DN24324_c0_g1_i1.p1  ORF type:complete len:1253 (+),score=220.87 TRINITY_DN24324_c0_g1_i1:54-3812(+)
MSINATSTLTLLPTATVTPLDTATHIYFCARVNDVCLTIDACQDKSHTYHADSLKPPYSVMALASAIGIGALLRWAAKEGTVVARVPYTILVFLVGLLYGFLSTIGEENDNFLDNGTELADIDPHLIFYIFLPILIFESAFSIDGHVFKKVAPHCILLAGPGIVIASGCTASLAKLILPASDPYGWSWVTCLLLGAILSATDPVAVVALLKELGCSAEVSTLIEGESLFNDGTAIVIFTILKDAVPSGVLDKSAGEIVWELFRISIGGPILGVIVAVILEGLLSRVFNDPYIEVTLSVAAAYITFFVAEGVLHISGVLALVLLGLYLSMHRQCFSPEVEHMLHGFWGILVFMANTVIFSLAGLIVSKKAFSDISASDYGWLLLMYLIINAVRAVVLLVLSPILRKFRYKLDMNNGALVTWGGLRGAVGLALVLIVENDQDIACSHPHLGPHFIFFGSGIVILTLVVNGISTGYLVKRLGLADIPTTRKKAMSDAHEVAVKEQERTIHELASESVMAMANWSQVRHFTVERAEDPYGGCDGDSMTDSFTMGRDAYFKVFIAELWHLNHQGTLQASSTRWLLEKSQVVRDANKAQIQSEKFKKSSALLHTTMLHDLFKPSFVDRIQAFVVPCYGLKSSLEGNLEAKRWLVAFEITTAYIQSHEAIHRKIGSFNLPQETVNRIRDHCKQERSEGLALLGEHEVQRPKVAVAIKTKQASRVVLNRSRDAVEKEISGGRLEPGDGTILIEQIEKNMEVLKRDTTKQMNPPDASEVLQQVPWASKDESALRKLLTRSENKTVGKGSIICEPGNTVIILTGVGKENVMGTQYYLGPGHTVGLFHALNDGSLETQHNTATADTDLTVLSIPHSELMTIARQYPVMLNAMWYTAGVDASQKVLAQTGDFQKFNRKDLAELCNGGSIISETSEEIVLKRGTIYVLLHGTAKSCESEPSSPTGHGIPVVKAVCMVPSSFTTIQLGDNSRLFAIPDTTSQHMKATKAWKSIANRISIIHTCITVLTERESCRYMRSPIIKSLIHGFFGKGRSLDIITGGFQMGDRWDGASLGPGSPLHFGSPTKRLSKEHAFPTGLGSLLQDRQMKKNDWSMPDPLVGSQSSGLVEPLLSAGRQKNPSFARGELQERPQSPDLIAAQNLELAAAALRDAARSRSVTATEDELRQQLAHTKTELEKERRIRNSLSPISSQHPNPLWPKAELSSSPTASSSLSFRTGATGESKKTFIEKLFEKPAESIVHIDDLKD